ncbi:MAG: ABC transporter permease [Anaerolineales bacterium]|nr:ABC transporter permease [Anaerolineales bacterium]
MILRFIGKRMRQQWRVWLLLLAAMSLVSAFFALGPLYLDYANEILLRYLLDNASARDDKFILASTVAYDEWANQTLDERIGFLREAEWEYQRGGYNADSPGDSLCAAPPPTPEALEFTGCVQPFTFGPYLSDWMTLVDGRWPEAVDTTGEPMIDDFGLPISPPQEVAVTTTVAEERGLELGTVYAIGGQGGTVQLIVVGIMEPKDPNDLFWDSNRLLLTGAEVMRGFITYYDWGFVLHPDAYQSTVLPLLAYNSYVKYIDLDTSQITATNAPDIRQRMLTLITRLESHQGRPLSFSNGLLQIFTRHERHFQDVQDTIILLSMLLLLMMLYNLAALARLALESQQHEWSMLSSRGSGFSQLVQLQFIPALLMGIIAAIMGVALTKVLLTVVGYVGSNTASDEHFEAVRTVSIPTISYILSVVAAAACVLGLVYPATRRISILETKQAISRPATRPAWSRFFLDGVFIGLGVLFSVRLYWTMGGDLAHLLGDLFTAPSAIIQEVTDNVVTQNGLSDPFNILAPTLLLTGAILLWLRLFPYLMRGLALVANRLRSLGVPMAVWNVERNTTHYGQFVLLLIGTLAVGITSVSLHRTQQVGAWEVATNETGGGIRLTFDPQQVVDLNNPPWASQPHVTRYSHVLYAAQKSRYATTDNPVHLFGIQPAEFDDVMLQSLQETEMVGLALPADAQRLSVDVWSTPALNASSGDIRVGMMAYLYDARGLLYAVQLVDPSEASPIEVWFTLTGDLPTTGRAPYHLWQVGMLTSQGDRNFFNHTVYLDNWQTIDSQGQATPFEDYETDHQWEPAQAAYPFVGEWVETDPRRDNIYGATPERLEWDGSTALQIEYSVSTTNTRGTALTVPSLRVASHPVTAIPVVISPAFSRNFRGEYGEAIDSTIPPLAVGDRRGIGLDFGQQGNAYVEIEVVGILESFPTMNSYDQFMIMPRSTLGWVFNQLFSDEQVALEVNQAWLTLDQQALTDEEKDAFRALPAVEDVTFAWDVYGEILREPIPNTVASLFFAGFWISLPLSLMNFAFYLAVTAKQRSFSFGVLRSLGWDINHIWRLLLMEQLVLIIPGILIGSLAGVGLAYLLLPFMGLPGQLTLRLPYSQFLMLVGALIGGFLILLGNVTLGLRRMSLHQVLRQGEE